MLSSQRTDSGVELAGELNSTYLEITRTIKSVERKILAFQARVVGQGRGDCRRGQHLAIILALGCPTSGDAWGDAKLQVKRR